MSNGVHVIVATYGDEVWKRKAEVAVVSAEMQTERPQWITRWHETDSSDPSEGRNRAAAEVPEAEWLIFLDADDTLGPGYVEAMLQGTADVRQPSTAGVHLDGTVEDPWLIPKKDLLTGNYIVIGAMIKRAAFEAVGGFRSLPIYEDWDLWLRMEEHGCTFESIPAAVYYVTVNPDSRNNQAPQIQRQWFANIRNEALARRQ